MEAQTTTERASKQFWAVTEVWEVKLVTGFECSPPNGDIWWVPELGYSLSEKHHLFRSADEARKHAITELESKIAKLQNVLTGLQQEEESRNV